VKKRSANK